MGKLIHFPKKKSSDKPRTVQDVFNTLTEEQKEVVYFMIGAAIEDTERKRRTY